MGLIAQAKQKMDNWHLNQTSARKTAAHAVCEQKGTSPQTG